MILSKDTSSPIHNEQVTQSAESDAAPTGTAESSL